MTRDHPSKTAQRCLNPSFISCQYSCGEKVSSVPLVSQLPSAARPTSGTMCTRRGSTSLVQREVLGEPGKGCRRRIFSTARTGSLLQANKQVDSKRHVAITQHYPRTDVHSCEKLNNRFYSCTKSDLRTCDMGQISVLQRRKTRLLFN